MQAMLRAGKTGRSSEARASVVDALALLAFVAASGPAVTLEVMHRLEGLRATRECAALCSHSVPGALAVRWCLGRRCPPSGIHVRCISRISFLQPLLLASLPPPAMTSVLIPQAAR